MANTATPVSPSRNATPDGVAPDGAAPDRAARSAAPEPPPQGPGAWCAPNIGPSERRKRWVVAAVGLAVCALASVALIADGAPRLWRSILVLPWWTASLGIFQARARVCVALAARGVRNLDGQQEPQPVVELDAVRREARRVHVRSLLTAVLLTLLTIAWP